MQPGFEAAVGDIGAAPLVSVVTPFFNAQRFLAEAIESVLAQTFSAWELVLVDDGSQDDSAGIAKEYVRRDPHRIRYLAHEGNRNRGKSVSRNLGIAHAKGSLLTFLDADDVFLPDKLSRQVVLLKRYPQAVMAYGTTQYWVTWDPRIRSRKGDRLGKLGVLPDRLYLPPDLLEAYLRDPGIVPCICGLLARTDVVRTKGAFDEQIQNLFEDQVLLVKLLLAGPVFVESGCGERYRQHAGSSSAQAIAAGEYHPTRGNPARLVFLEWLKAYIVQCNVNSPALQRALAGAFRPYQYPRLYRALHPFLQFLSRFK